MSVLIRGMDMPKRCYDCGLYKSLHMDSDGYGDNCDYCGALKRRFNQDKCDINPFKQKLSDCPLIEVADTPQTDEIGDCNSCEYLGDLRCGMCTNGSGYRRRADTPQTESTGSRIGDYRDGVGAWQTERSE